MSVSGTHYSAHDIETRILAGLRAAGLDPEIRMTPEQLGPLDHFHTGGFQSSLRLKELARISSDDRVLDIGAGLAGPARMLAASPGCYVDCIELSDDYCSGAALLNRLTDLEDKVKIHKGSALDMPFPDNTFDVIWMQNVGMNISDKRSLYTEFYRVLKPGGRFAFQEMASGRNANGYYFPLPWASVPEDNFLIPTELMRTLLLDCGFIVDIFEDVSNEILNPAPITIAAPSQNPNIAVRENIAQTQLGLSVFVDNLAQKADNSRRSLQEEQIRFVRGVFKAK